MSAQFGLIQALCSSIVGKKILIGPDRGHDVPRLHNQLLCAIAPRTLFLRVLRALRGEISSFLKLDVFNEIDSREDHDPDDVDKVPVESGGLDVDGVLVGIEFRGVRIDQPGDQPENPEGNVNPVRAGHQVEGGPKGSRGDRETRVSHEVVKLVDLPGEEEASKYDDADEVQAEALHFPFVDSGYRQGHEERAHQKDEAARGGQLDVKYGDRIHSYGFVDLPINQVSRDQGPEKHTIRGQKQPHHEFFWIESRRDVISRMGCVCLSCLTHFSSSG